MARFAKFNAAIDRIEARLSELTDADIAAMRSTPEALARQAKDGAKRRKASAASEQRRQGRMASAIAANTFTAGQQVRSRRRIGADFLLGTVEKVEGSTIILADGRCFAASAFEAV